MIIYGPGSFARTAYWIRQDLLDRAARGEVVDTGHWQSLKNVPHTRTFEIHNAVLQMNIGSTVEEWVAEIQPNLPWAEDHFQERVAGEPLNPGQEYRNWPWYKGGVENHKQTGQFSHTYMERFWPAHDVPEGEQAPRMGIRYRYGDLQDLVDLLTREPFTRQAYLPVWFPEDTGAHHGERVPCTLGYHFMLRDSKLHCNYFIRSCDFVRYLRDDVYMAGRLTQWLIDQVPGFFEEAINPGELLMVIPSLHCFEGDIPKLEREHAAYTG